MLKVVAVVDKVGTALDRLAKGVEKYNYNIDYEVVDVHPKKPSMEQIKKFVEVAMFADIIDWQYFRTAEMLRKEFDWLKDKKHILTHNNPYSITESNWNNYDINVGNNKEIYENLKKITQSRVEYIPLVADSTFWEMPRELTKNNNVIMVANRIEAKKGILPVAIACAELNIRMKLVGAISDRDYMQAIEATGVVDFYEQVDDEKLRKLYHDSMLHVCNSVDGFESGTLPILEAMYSGVPVLTRKIGHVPDIYNGENMLIIDHDNEDVIKLIDDINDAINDKKRLEVIREKAWNSVKSRNFERRAFAYQKLYRSVMYDDTSVTVIMPIVDINNRALESLQAVANQTYKNIEIIIVDDMATKANYDAVIEFSKYTDKMIRYMISANQDYGLARARNIGAIEATGEILVFLDQRIKIKENAVEILVSELQPKTWLYGTKGVKKDFVENFSCIYKKDFINFGMFNERMDCYGGLSQETRNRARNQGIVTRFIEKAEAVALGSSKNKYEKRSEIIRSKNRLYKMGLE